MPFDFPNQPAQERSTPQKSRKNLPVLSDESVARLSAQLDDIQVAAPCNASWEDMSGDDQVRFCGLCTKNVYNFSDMSRTQIASLLMTTEGRVCGRFYKRADGTLLTTDCPVGVAERAYRMARRSFLAGLAFVAMLVGGLLSFLGASEKNPVENVINRIDEVRVLQGELERPVAGGIRAMPIEEERMTMGDVVYQEPAQHDARP